MVVGWALFMVFSLVMAARAGGVVAWLFASLMYTLWAAFSATMLVGIAEFIKLMLDIQSNTLTTARNTAGRSEP